jgi:putative heme-binding domain-containing protein
VLDAIESKQITRASIDLVQSQRLGKLTDKTLAARANELLSASSASRKSVIEQYRPVVSQSGDPVAGKQVFQTACANCHRIGDLGRDLGPDISDSRTKTTEQLLQSILDPDAAIDAGFVRYTLLTADGRVLDGLLVDETAERVALRPIEGDDLIIAKEDIEQLKSAGVSLMPTGFEATIPPHAMRDLVAYIKQWRYLDGAVPADLGQVK